MHTHKLLHCMLLASLLASAQKDWVYPRVICTGLGDRLGVLLSLAAASRAYTNMTIVFRWCGVEGRELAVLDNPQLLHSIRHWNGYVYPLSELHSHFPQLPPGVKPVEEWPPARGGLLLSDGLGLPFLPSLGHAIFQAEGRPRLTADEFQRAYKEAALLLQPASVRGHFDIVVHLRAWDENTPYFDIQPQHFCTLQVLEALVAEPSTLGLTIGVLSHDRIWAKKMLGPRFRRLLLRQASPWEDMALLLSARRGIIQHASGGWSSFSSVPALARPHVTLINTYYGPDEHRFDYFERALNGSSGGLRCHQLPIFVAKMGLGGWASPTTI